MSTHPAAAPVPPEGDTSGNVNLHSRLQALAHALQSLGPDELARVVGTQDDARSLDSLMQLCTPNAPTVSNPPLAPLPTLNPRSGEPTSSSHHPASSNSPSVPSSFSSASLATAPTSGSSHPLPGLVVPNSSAFDSKVFGRDMNIGRAFLETVFYYDSIDDFCEYPKSSLRGIGHLVPIPPSAINDKDYNPASDIQYSLGDGSGFSTTKTIRIPILVDDQGVEVDCVFSYRTCQGIKACPFLDDTLKTTHYEASREAVSERLQSTRALNVLPDDFGKQKSWHLMAELRSRTLNFYTSLMSHGCGGPPQEETVRSGEELEAYEFQQEGFSKARRGHPPKPSCDGRILFCDGPKPSVRCEHYGNGSRDHLRDMSPSDGIYDLDYLRALFNKDQDIIDDVEEELLVFHQLGPRASCTYTMNCSSVRVHCPTPHRTETGELIMAEMERITCTCKFRVYLPKLGQRHRCPWALIVSLGIHTHPVPVPSRTPYIIREKLSDLLTTMPDDLADLTPRRFMRHPTLQSFLVTELNVTSPLQAPQLSDLHPSLANRDHVNAIIEKVRAKVLPKGVGWNGLLHIKEEQDQSGTRSPYLRYMSEYLGSDGQVNRIVVCMTPESSKCLLLSQFLQSDISFKRLVEFLEFALGIMDPIANLSRVLARIFVTRQDADTHLRIFQKIDEIVQLDTGEQLRWRHLHSPSLSTHVGISLLSVDQQGGQVKGFGMYLQGRAKALPPTQDLHEPTRMIQSLDEYDHARRMVRLCTNHIFRNIRSSAVPDHVRAMMRSLVCVRHDSWDETVAKICAEGGNAGKNWVDDKIRSKFAFPAMCQEKSFVPFEIWQLGERTTNLIEALHADANREGTSCSLVGGFLKGLRFDMAKEKSSETLVDLGILPSYDVSTIGKRMQRSLKRKSDANHQFRAMQDKQIIDSNKRLKTAREKYHRAEKTHRDLVNCSNGQNNAALSKASESLAAAKAQYEVAKARNIELAGTGTGHVDVQVE